MSIWETYQAAYQVATEEQKTLVDSDLIPSGVNQLISLGTLDASQKRLTMSVYSLFMLNALSLDEAVAQLTQAGVPESTRVLSDLKQYVTKQNPTQTESIPENNTLETTHTSSQDAILGSQTSQANSVPSTPRWGSEQS
jgi:hypothetical protein